MARYPGCNMVISVDVTRVFQNCARYIHKHTRVGTIEYVPDKDGKQPFPAWKRIDAIQDFLHEKDQGKAGTAGGLITEDEYLEEVSKGTS